MADRSLQLRLQAIGPSGDVARTEADEDVSSGAFGFEKRRKVIGGSEFQRALMAMVARGAHQGIGVHALNRGFASGIDVCDGDNVCIVETAGEILKQGLQAAEAVGLDDSDNFAGGDLAGGFEDGSNLDRMVAIIINDAYTLPLTHFGKAAREQ